MTEVHFKYKTRQTSNLSWSEIKPCWITNAKSRDEIEGLAKKVWKVSPRICAVMWESTDFFGEERRSAVPASQKEDPYPGFRVICNCGSQRVALVSDEGLGLHCLDCAQETELKKTPMSQEEFLEGSGDFCPSCRSDSLNEKDTPVFGYILLQKAYCLNCDTSWKKEYKLNGYRDLKEGA